MKYRNDIFDEICSIHTIGNMKVNTSDILDDDDTLRIRKYLKNIFSGFAFKGFFVFRKVERVFYENPRFTKFTLHEEQTPLNTIYGVSKADRDRYVQVDCKSFYGETEKRPIRNEVFPIKGRSLRFDSDTYHNLSFEEESFGELTKSEAIAPFEGDLLCLLIKGDTPRIDFVPSLKADAWFIASDQFLKAWTSVMFDKHESLTSLIPKNYGDEYESLLRSKLYSGNRLASNTWLKHTLTCREHNKSMTKEESRNMYYHLRTDKCSIMYVDCWALMVLMGRYGELPNFRNVPNNKDGLQRKQWNIPKGAVRNLLKLSGCTVDISDDILNRDVCSDDLCTVIEDRDLPQPPKVEIQIKLSAKQLVLLIDWSDDKDDNTY